MDIHFASDRFKNLCNNDRQLRKQHGAVRAKKIRQRLDDLRAVKTLAVMRQLPGRCHELKGDRAGQLSLDLDHPYRLIFQPDHDPVPAKADGGLDWTAVTRIMIMEIADTHE